MHRREFVRTISLAFAGVAVGAPAYQAFAQEKTVQNVTAYEALKMLLPHEKTLASSTASAAEKTKASNAIYAAQSRLVGFFGNGAEIYAKIQHKGQSFTVPIDLDAALLRFRVTNSPGRRDKGFYVMSTPAMVEPAHQAIQGTAGNLTAAMKQREENLRAEAKAQFIPLNHEDAQGYVTHLKDFHDFDVDDVWIAIQNPVAINGRAQKSVDDWVEMKNIDLMNELKQRQSSNNPEP